MYNEYKQSSPGFEVVIFVIIIIIVLSEQFTVELIGW